MKKIILSLLTVILLVGCGKATDGLKFKEEYEGLNGKNTSSGKKYIDLVIDRNNIMKYSSLEEVIDIIDKKSGVIYLGYPECPWCRNMVPILLKAADSTSLENIYYLNMTNIRDKKVLNDKKEVITEEKGNEKYFTLLEKLDSILEDYILTDDEGNTYETGEKRIYVPTVLFIYEGQLVGYHFNTVESQTDPYTKLNTEQKKELYNIYEENIHKVLNDLCEEDSEGC